MMNHSFLRRFFTLIFTLGCLLRGYAGEGMWIPLLLGQLNEADMQAMGMKMTAEDIYSVNAGSLKDAIVHFGGFCTGEVISSQGLVLTNHHCGYEQVQNHSSLEHNYLQDGFWARSLADELPNPGLFVTFIVRIDDVTKTVLDGVTNNMDKKERQQLIEKNLKVAKEAAAKETWQDVLVRPFFHGNQYFLFVTETYNDVRLVGAPS
ncbi:MAG: S46 family peptidase [Saprospiraceae bacterium]